MSWSRAFHVPITTPDGLMLRTLRDAGEYMQALPRAKHKQLVSGHTRLDQVRASKTRPILQALFAILQHLHLLQGDEPTGHHVIEYRQELVDLRLRVHNLDDDGKVVRQSKYLGRVKAA